MFKLIIFLTFITIVYSKHPDEIASDCKRENNVVRDGDHENMLTLLTNDDEMSSNEQCYFKCFNQRSFMMDENANFTPREGMTFLLSQNGASVTDRQLETVLTLMSDCSFPDIENHCEKAANISKCLNEAPMY